jgi:hypothetical protein
MAQETRAQLYAKILANLPDNTTEQITPATDRAVEDAEVESCYNLLDDTAVNVNYNPTTVGDWNPEEPTGPTEVGRALDILATRTSKNLSDDIAYVSNSGNDTTAELGNPLKPFLTFAAAVSAVPLNNFIIKSLGGEFTNVGGENWINTNKSNGIIDLSGTKINSTFVRTNGDNVTILLHGGEINTVAGTSVELGFSGSVIGCRIIGGKVINNLTNGTAIVLNNNCEANGVYAQATNGVGISNIGTTSKQSRIERCEIVASRGSLGGNLNIIDSVYKTTGICLELTTEAVTIENSSLTTTGGTYVCRGQGGGTLNIYGISSYLKNESVTGKGIGFGSSVNDNVYFQNCIIYGATGAIEYTGGVTTSANVDHVYKECALYCDSGSEPFAEPVSYSGSFLGNIRSINNTYSEAQTLIVGTKITEYNKTEITGLQLPQIEI